METTDIFESDVGKRVKQIILEKLEVKEEEIISEAKLVDDLGADSLDIVEMIMAFEEEFNIEIPDDDLEGIVTVGDVVNHIQQKGEKEKTIRLVIDCPI